MSKLQSRKPFNQKIVQVTSLFDGGMNSVVYPSKIKDNEFSYLQNIDLHSLNLKRRGGWKIVDDNTWKSKLNNIDAYFGNGVYKRSLGLYYKDSIITHNMAVLGLNNELNWKPNISFNNILLPQIFYDFDYSKIKSILYNLYHKSIADSEIALKSIQEDDLKFFLNNVYKLKQTVYSINDNKIIEKKRAISAPEYDNNGSNLLYPINPHSITGLLNLLEKIKRGKNDDLDEIFYKFITYMKEMFVTASNSVYPENTSGFFTTFDYKKNLLVFFSYRKIGGVYTETSFESDFAYGRNLAASFHLLTKFNLSIGYKKIDDVTDLKDKDSIKNYVFSPLKSNSPWKYDVYIYSIPIDIFTTNKKIYKIKSEENVLPETLFEYFKKKPVSAIDNLNTIFPYNKTSSDTYMPNTTIYSNFSADRTKKYSSYGFTPMPALTQTASDGGKFKLYISSFNTNDYFTLKSVFINIFGCSIRLIWDFQVLRILMDYLVVDAIPPHILNF